MQYSDWTTAKESESSQSQERGNEAQKDERGKAGKEGEQVRIDCQGKLKIN